MTSVPDLDPEILAQRKHKDAECENCDLISSGTFVPSKFPTTGEDAQYAVVGEAPGFYETIRGEPFIGDSGKLLNKVLDLHNIKRENLLLTNTCLCRPDDKNSTPSQQAQRSCRGRLVKELEEANPKRVLALGASATQTLMRSKAGILEQRVGNARESPDGFTVVPSVHPAYCLRNGDAFPYLLRDVEKLYRDMPPWKPPEYVVADDEELALAWIKVLSQPSPIGKYINGKRVLVFDIECGIDKDNDYDHPDRYEMLCIGVGYAKGKVVVFGERVMSNKKVIAALAQLLKDCLLVAHNGKFDCAGVYPIMGEILLWFDTMLAHYCIDERPGNHKLGQLGPEILGTPDWKHAIDKYLGTGKNYAAIPRPELYKYNAYDDAVTWDLMEYFLVVLERNGLRPLHDFLVDASNQLKFMELNGIAIDRQRNIELTDEYMEILDSLREQIDGIVQDPKDDKSRKDYEKNKRLEGLNPNSPAQVKEYLHDHGYKVAKTEADVLERLLERIDAESNVGRFLSLLLEHRFKAKRHGTYVKGIRNRMYRGRVYTSYLLHGTTSGRLASRNPNLQNIVRDAPIKSQFTVSKVGNIFVAADYKQAEGRIICTLAQDEYLAGIFRDADRDLFNELGLGLYPGKTTFTKDERVRIKAYFYGLGYGREAFSIAQEYRLPVGEVEEGLKKFFGLIPDVVKWQASIKEQVLNGNDLVTEFGRHRRFYLITDQNKKEVLNEGLSFLPQSEASDICLRAFIRLRPRLRGKAFFRLTIHDALVAECKEEDKEYVAQVMREEMIRSAAEWTTYVPFDVDVSYGKNWGELS